VSQSNKSFTHIQKKNSMASQQPATYIGFLAFPCLPNGDFWCVPRKRGMYVLSAKPVKVTNAVFPWAWQMRSSKVPY